MEAGNTLERMMKASDSKFTLLKKAKGLDETHRGTGAALKTTDSWLHHHSLGLKT